MWSSSMASPDVREIRKLLIYSPFDRLLEECTWIEAQRPAPEN